jgi:hypothetical protein
MSGVEPMAGDDTYMIPPAARQLCVVGWLAPRARRP